MMTLDDISLVGMSAAHQAAEFILENLVKDKLNPTSAEAEAVSTALLFAIASLETNLKINLPESARHNTRAALDQLSTILSTKVGQIRAAAENEIPKTTN